MKTHGYCSVCKKPNQRIYGPIDYWTGYICVPCHNTPKPVIRDKAGAQLAAALGRRSDDA